ncbi:MAG TPA: adenylate/guanylate cyclase domain-containing protein [Acidimicrobiales bacterium]|nr:adenylate/guanylate cyclase domain-containing protein [Acidimicrobiales bacterium]
MTSPRASERRQLTVVFTDLVGSTELASALDPEDWHEVLDSYQHRVAEIVTSHGGVIAQFQGDGAIAYFGYPEATESAGREALSAAMDIVGAIEVLGAELSPTLGIGELRARAGIHTGEVLVAPVTAGGQERLPDVWGQVPNLAARLQAAGNPGQVVISGDTSQLVAGFFELESLGPLALKGIAEPVLAFAVLQRSGARHRLEARRLGGFVQRPEAWTWLRGHWDAAAAGAGRLVLVSGEPGIGKSRLLFEFGNELSASGHAAVTVLCNRRSALSPLHPFEEVMGELPATPREAADWVEGLSRDGPLLLIVEDVHWADPSTMESLHVIARGSTPVLVAMSARPEIEDDQYVKPDGRFTLTGLDGNDAHALIEHLPESDRLSREMRVALVSRSEGVPLFLEELARGVADGPEGLGSTLPTTLSEVITARLDRVGGDAKRVAQAASIIGRVFDRPVLIAAAGLDVSSLDVNLERLREHAIIEPTGRTDELQFRHALFHEASYRSVLRADRARIHAAVGEMLVTSGRVAGRPEIAAYHLGAAGRAVEAVPLWRQAAHTARQNARFQEAAGHERALLALVDQLPESEREPTELRSRSRLVMCLTAVDQSAPEALEESRRVEELARRLGDREILLRNHMILIPWWQASAEYRTINSVLAEARKEATELNDTWALQLITTYEATTRIWQGMIREGLEQMRTSYAASGLPLEASLRDLPPMRSVELMALAAPRVATALACWLRGRSTEAWRIANDVLHCTTERRVPQAQAVAAVTAAIIAQLDGEREIVLKLSGEAVHVADEVSTRQWKQWARSLQWWAGEGIDEPEIPGPLLRPYFQMLTADDERMDDPRAIAVLTAAIETSNATGERFCEAEILRMRGDRRAAAGSREAEDDYRTAVNLARQQGSKMLELRALSSWAGHAPASDQVRQDLAACIEDVSSGGPSRSLDRARHLIEEQ